MEKSQRTDIIKLNGFMSGLLRTRAGLPFGDAAPDDDPFMVGYNRGDGLREQIVTEAIETIQPDYSSVVQLSRLVGSCEKLLADIEHGTFDTSEFANAVAFARVHLARVEAGSRGHG